MKLLNTLERKIGAYAIPHLAMYLIAGQAIFFVVGGTNPQLLEQMMLRPDLVMQGEVWRLLTFVFYPPSSSPLFLFFELYLFWLFSNSLEQTWGTFRYNVYLGIAFVGTVIAAFAVYLLLGVPVFATNQFALTSVFLAFAFLYPNFELLLFFVLPVKVKWLGLLTWAYYAYFVVLGGWIERALIVAAVANFFLFFWSDLGSAVRNWSRARRNKAEWERKNRPD